jgi:hypothetical protein
MRRRRGENEIERFGAILDPDQVVREILAPQRAIVISASVSLSSANRISTCS